MVRTFNACLQRACSVVSDRDGLRSIARGNNIHSTVAVIRTWPASVTQQSARCTDDEGRRCEARPEVAVVRSAAAQPAGPPASSSPGRCAYGLPGTSRQRNTHSNESREVRYPWHPWHDRMVTTHRSFTRNGRALFCCSTEESLEGRFLEIPQWMFDPAICCRMQLAAVPTVSCEALLDLKAVLQCALPPDRDVVLQAQHPCLLSLGGADAKVTEPTQGLPTQTISSMPSEPGLAGAASGSQAENGEVVSTTAARTFRKSPGRGQQRGGGR